MELNRVGEEYANMTPSRHISGRLSLRTFCKSYILDEERGIHTDIVDLYKVRIKSGPDAIAIYFATWNTVVAGDAGIHEGAMVFIWPKELWMESCGLLSA